VSLDKRRFVPEDFGLLVTVFLKQYFSQYVEYDFTANLEEKLDGIASSSQDWQQVLTLFWQQFNATVTGTADLKIGEVLDELNRALSGHFFPENPERTCPTCKKGKLSLRLGKYGGYISCDAYPECQYVRRLQEDPEADAQQIGEDGEAIALPRDLGFDPETKEPVTVKRGPYGIYMQLGLDGDKPKRSPLPEGVGAADVTLEQALKCLSLPKNLGDHPETGYAVSVGVGRFGPFVKYREVFYSLKEHDPYELDLPTALTVLTKGFETKRPLGKHPKKKKMIVVSKTRYGWMVGMGKIKSSLGKTQDPQTLTLDEAIALIDQKDK
jgi:DNA topoisomerase-1